MDGIVIIVESRNFRKIDTSTLGSILSSSFSATVPSEGKLAGAIPDPLKSM